MTAKRSYLSLILLAGCAMAASSEPGTFSDGTHSAAGWTLHYTAVARPPLPAGQHVRIQTDATHTKSGMAPVVFHRFFTDPVTKTYFGYDLVVEPFGQTGNASVRFQPLSLHAGQLPAQYASSDFKAVGLPRFPVESFKTGQIIAVDVLQNPATGQKVVDYVQVARETQSGSTAAAAPDREAAKTKGRPDAPVRIDLFSDYQCPACKNFHEIMLLQIIRDYVLTGKAYIVTHEFPLPMHAHARDAAIWATAAAQVGKYEEVGDALFRDQATWASTGQIAQTVAGVLSPAEMRQVESLVTNPDTLAQVQQDIDLATTQQIRQTPTLIVSRGARRYPFAGPGQDNYQILKALIDELLK